MWRGYPDDGYYDSRWLTGLWSTQAKVEGIVMKAAWHGSSDSNVVNYPLGEPDCTQVYVGLSSAWGSADSDHMISTFSWECSLTGDFA